MDTNVFIKTMNMKKIIFLLCISFICINVSAKRVGVFCFFADNGSQIYEDEIVKLAIIFDDNSGQLAIYNKTDNVIYIDRGSSFAYINDNPETFFQNKAYTTSHTTGNSTSLNLGGIANALGINGLAGGLLQGTTVSEGNAVQNGVTVYEQRIIAVAPKSIRLLYSFDDLYLNLRNIDAGEYANGFRDLDLGQNGKFIDPLSGKNEKFKKGMIKHFGINDTPLSLKGVIKYSTEENFVSSKLAQVSNYVSDIVIDSYKGVKHPNKLRYCQPYMNQQYYCFKTGGSNPLSFIAGWTTWTAIIAGCAGLTIWAVTQ